MSKFLNLLNWQPTVAIEDGILKLKEYDKVN